MSRYGIWAVALLLGTPYWAWSQSVALVEESIKDKCFRITLALDLKGKITVQQEGKPISFDRAAHAKHDFVERVLETRDNFAIRAARHYTSAEATLTEDKESLRRSLRPKLALLMAQRVKDATVIFHHRQPLTLEEVEVTEHFDTLHLAGLLPGKEVAVGATWPIAPAVTQALCAFDGLLKNELTGKFEKVDGEQAHLSIMGKAQGIDMGAQVDLLVTATAIFDIKSKRVVRIDWKQSDQRKQGPVSPALSADVAVTVTRTPLDETPAALSDFALVPFPVGGPPEALTALSYSDAKHKFSFQHGRDWHVVGVDAQVVLRLMDRGDFVAQATLMPWKKMPEGMMTPLAQFEQLMAEAPGWEPDRLLTKPETHEGPDGARVHRVAAEGGLDGVKVCQYFYLIASKQGEQMIVTFTMTPSQAAKLDTRDWSLVRSVRFDTKVEREAGE